MSIYQMVYAKDKRRPAYFSFMSVVKYKELRKLLVLSFLIQTACYMNLNEDQV